MKIELDKTIERDGKIYHLSLITEDWYFYSDYENNMPKSNTLGFDKNTDEEIAPEHAYFGLYMHLPEDKHLWISDKLKSIYNKVKK